MSGPITSRVTSKGQVTVPKQVRKSLQIAAGDSLVYELRGDHVVLRKLPRVDVDWARAVESTLTEWQDELDDEL